MNETHSILPWHLLAFSLLSFYPLIPISRCCAMSKDTVFNATIPGKVFIWLENRYWCDMTFFLFLPLQSAQILAAVCGHLSLTCVASSWNHCVTILLGWDWTVSAGQGSADAHCHASLSFSAPARQSLLVLFLICSNTDNPLSRSVGNGHQINLLGKKFAQGHMEL